MSANHHWDYFQALEEDVLGLTRFIHFAPENLEVYSIELARLLMASTQEVDVLLKKICAGNGDKSENEKGYRNFFRKGQKPYDRFPTIIISIHRYGLTFQPFGAWANDKTPEWWTANNKVKHERHTLFSRASLSNVLQSLSGLLIANVYHSCLVGADSVVKLKLLSLPQNMVSHRLGAVDCLQVQTPFP